MTKTQVIIEAKRQHDRLRNNAYSFRKATQEPFDPAQLKRLDNTLNRWQPQLDTELGKPLYKALKAFRKAYEGDIEEDVTEAYQQLLKELWAYRTNHWQAIENKHGTISHYFDRYGQIKPKYRNTHQLDQEDEEGELLISPFMKGVFIVIIMLGIWWFGHIS